MNFTIDDIITALHCCNNGRTACSSCPLAGLRNHNCLATLHEHAITAIVDYTALVARISTMLDDASDSIASIRSVCK